MEHVTTVEKAGTANEINTYLSFSLGNDSYALDVSQIREVLEYEQITHLTRIPMVHESILGVVNLRGEIIPIIDLSMRLSGSKVSITDDACVIVADISDAEETVTIGAMVERVNGVINISEKNICSIPDFGTKINYEFIDCIGKIGDSFIILLNIIKLLNVDDLSEMASAETDIAELLSMKLSNRDEKLLSGELTDNESGLSDKGDIHNFVTLAVGDDTYAIDIMHIHEIANISQMMSLPNTLPFMKGLINLRGEMVPVVDLRTRCGLESKEYNKKTNILIVKVDNYLIGLVSDIVLNVIKFPVNDVQHPPHYSAMIDTDFIEGLLQVKEKAIILLNVKKILSPDEFSLIKNKDFTGQE